MVTGAWEHSKSFEKDCLVGLVGTVRTKHVQRAMHSFDILYHKIMLKTFRTVEPYFVYNVVYFVSNVV